MFIVFYGLKHMTIKDNVSNIVVHPCSGTKKRWGK